MRCLALFTGGLDSLLAVRLMQQQGIEVVALHCGSPLVDVDSDLAVEVAAAKLGIELIVADLGEAYARFLRQPRFGYVSGAAACTDCRIAMLAAAREKMTECGADFVASGEVVGQRPRTAIRDLEVVAHHAGLAELLVRPLSAQLLQPTAIETRGSVNRERLLGLQGKSRKSQLELARSFDIDPPPARADCPLLAGRLAERSRELIASKQRVSANDLTLLTLGRHIRLDPETKVILGRNQRENLLLDDLADFTGAYQHVFLAPVGIGPFGLLCGTSDERNILLAAELVACRTRTGDESAVQVCVVAHFPHETLFIDRAAAIENTRHLEVIS